MVPRSLETAAAWAWRLVIVAIAGWLAVQAVVRLKLVLLPMFAALLLATVLLPPARWLHRRMPAWAATWLTMLGFLAAVTLAGVALIGPLTTEFEDLRDTLDESLDDIEQWVVDGPFGLDAQEVSDLRTSARETIADSFRSNGSVVEGAVLVGELLAGLFLTLVAVFFFVKDGEEMQAFALRHLPESVGSPVRRMAEAAWSTLGRYLLGAAALGLVEAIIIGITLALVGSTVVLPVAGLTFVAAFFPIVGAITAGVVATLVALVSGGVDAALIVAVVALVVQQFDNDILAPVIYGRALSLHPLVILVALATGGTLGGITGAFLAVPLTAVVVNATVAYRQGPDGAHDGDADPDHDTEASTT